MRLVVFSHKPCWSGKVSMLSFASDGGFPLQMASLSELFDETRLVLPFSKRGFEAGEMPLIGHNLSIVPLTQRCGTGFSSKLSFLPWVLRNCGTILRELLAADAVHSPIPGDVGTVGMLGAFTLCKPLFVRHCGNWLKPVTLAEKFWRWFMERFAGGRNVMLATGGTAAPPSQKNRSIRWIFASSLSEQELRSYACERAYPPDGRIRLILVARQKKAKGAGAVIQSLPLLAERFPNVSFEIVGEGSAIPEFRRLAEALGLQDRVHFTGKLDHEQVMHCLKDATLFVFPTVSSDGFPKAVLEGLAAGLPVVGTRVSVLPQLIGNGCGVLIDKVTPEAVAQGVAAALGSAAAYEAMSRKAIETARQYSLEAWRDSIGEYLRDAWGTLRSGDRRHETGDGSEESEVRSQKSGVRGAEGQRSEVSNPVVGGP